MPTNLPEPRVYASRGEYDDALHAQGMIAIADYMSEQVSRLAAWAREIFVAVR